MDKKEAITVIVPTKDRKEALINCLNSIVNQTILPDEIIVVDNSKFKSAKKIVIDIQKKVRLNIRYLHESKKGSPYARNLGIKSAKFNILAFLDDDCRAEKNWIKEILKAYKKYGDVTIKGKNFNALPENVYSCVEHYVTEMVFENGYYLKDRMVYSRLLDTKNFSIKKSLIKKNRVIFDDLFAPFSICDDLDLALNLRKQGEEIIYSEKILSWHYGRNNLLSHIKREFNKGQALFYFNNKWRQYSHNQVISKFIYGALKKLNSEKKRIEANEKKLKKEAFKNKNFLFKLGFYLIIFISKKVIKTGYYYEKIKNI